MELSLQLEEVSLLHRILTDYLSDLRMEIANTENYDLRQELKHDEEAIKVLIDRLGKSRAAGA